MSLRRRGSSADAHGAYISTIARTIDAHMTPAQKRLHSAPLKRLSFSSVDTRPQSLVPAFAYFVLCAELFSFAKIPHDVRGCAGTVSRVLHLQICVRGIPPAVSDQSARPAAHAGRTDPAQAFGRRVAEPVVRTDRKDAFGRAAS